jgi:cation/acetate symporter
MVEPGATDANFVDGVVRVPEQALLLLANELGGGPLLGLVATAALAAILSTVAGLLIAAAVSWGHDVYEQFINPYAPEKRRIRLGQGAVILTASAAAAIGGAISRLEPRPSVALMVTWAFAIAGSGFTPTFLLCVWWKRMTALGAILGMIVGASTALALIGLGIAGRAVEWLPSVPFGNFPSIVAAPAAALVAVSVSLATESWSEPVASWLRMHGTAMERRQALLARLSGREEGAP